MTEKDRFLESVREIYNFLVKDYGFHLMIPEWRTGLETIIFQGPGYDIEIGWHKGQIDILFRVKLENSLFRPYISREFSFRETILFFSATAFNDPPLMPPWTITSADAVPVLRYYAELIDKHCDSVLRGDLEVFETLTKKRRKIV
ncbi:MAG TPA: hypothetical protein VK463_07110 [Desulfomonilaceae bacterium]|nr:hypothetical protein [Desulfomonilaceae bacterium]